jgi:hypothetical protein
VSEQGREDKGREDRGVVLLGGEEGWCRGVGEGGQGCRSGTSSWLLAGLVNGRGTRTRAHAATSSSSTRSGLAWACPGLSWPHDYRTYRNTLLR